MTTHFFKIVLSTEPRLRLPNKFVSKYKESLPSLVSVEGPHGPAFQVELTPSDGHVWLAKGFELFWDYFSIKPGYFLVFKCNFETSFFHVMIFDQTAMKVDYPLACSEGENTEKVSSKPCCLTEEPEVVSDTLEENMTLDDLARKQDISERKTLEEVEDDVSIDVFEEDNDHQVSGHFMDGNSGEQETENLKKVETYQNRKQTGSFINPAHETAKAFVSTTTTPSVVCFMRRSYIQGRLDINKHFSWKLLKKRNPCDVVLRVPGAKETWMANCRIRKNGARLYWRTFVKDNGLCEGDSCVFELGKGTTPSINVIIFRSTEDANVKGKLINKDLGEVSTKQKISNGKALEKVDNHDKSATEIDYPVTSFKRDKLGEAGDDVSIEILEEECFMNGTSRKRKLENIEKSTQKRNQALGSKKRTALQRAHAYISTRPSFVSFAHSSYINGGLSISKQFVQKFIKVEDGCVVVLRVPGDTKTWAVKCRIGSSNAILRWKKFVKDNGLCAGDACVFELGDNKTPSLNVIIFRSTEAQGIKVT